mmetsp:Transcript_137226/g.426433  ORF Transcript_137226/g.426433 Transcript_137226/m.426433 type:complete len:203 (+) Transcript_137226:74-682(+)
MGELSAASFVEWPDALSVEEADRIRAHLDACAAGSVESFEPVPERRAPWVYEALLRLAERADREAGWGLLSGGAAPSDELIYDRFGPAFSTPSFDWHVDAEAGDPRLVSVVVHLSRAEEFAGGEFLAELGGGAVLQRTYEKGWAVAFPSKGLRHTVTPVVAGERRSALLLVGAPPPARREAALSSWTGGRLRGKSTGCLISK